MMIERFATTECFPTGPPSFEGFQMDPSQVVEQFRPDDQKLSGLVTELSRENRRSETDGPEATG